MLSVKCLVTHSPRSITRRLSGQEIKFKRVSTADILLFYYNLLIGVMTERFDRNLHLWNYWKTRAMHEGFSFVQWRRQGQCTRVFHSYNEVKTKINSLKRRNILSADLMIREAARAVTPSPLVEGDEVICILIKPQASRLDGRVTFDLFPFTYQLLGVLQ